MAQIPQSASDMSFQDEPLMDEPNNGGSSSEEDEEEEDNCPPPPNHSMATAAMPNPGSANTSLHQLPPGTMLHGPGGDNSGTFLMPKSPTHPGFGNNSSGGGASNHSHSSRGSSRRSSRGGSRHGSRPGSRPTSPHDNPNHPNSPCSVSSILPPAPKSAQLAAAAAANSGTTSPLLGPASTSSTGSHQQILPAPSPHQQSTTTSAAATRTGGVSPSDDGPLSIAGPGRYKSTPKTNSSSHQHHQSSPTLQPPPFSNSSSTAIPIRANNYHTGGGPGYPTTTQGAGSASSNPSHSDPNQRVPPPYANNSPGGSMGRGGPSSFGSRGSGGASSYPGSGSHRYKTQRCATHYAGAICAHGANCNFAHNDNELRNTGTPPEGSALYDAYGRVRAPSSSGATCDDGGRLAGSMEADAPLPSFLKKSSSASALSRNTPSTEGEGRKPSSIAKAFGASSAPNNRSPSSSAGGIQGPPQGLPLNSPLGGSTNSLPINRTGSSPNFGSSSPPTSSGAVPIGSGQRYSYNPYDTAGTGRSPDRSPTSSLGQQQQQQANSGSQRGGGGSLSRGGRGRGAGGGGNVGIPERPQQVGSWAEEGMP